MVAKRIPQLTELLGTAIADNDELVIFDTDGNETKRITAAQLRDNLYEADSGSSKIGYLEGSTSSVERTVQNRLQDRLSVWDFGVAGTGLVDDTTALQAAIAAADSAGVPLHMDGATCLISTQVDLPRLLHGPGTITGDVVRWYRRKRVVTQGELLFDELHCNGFWFANVDRLNISGPIKFFSTDTWFGNFWNSFDHIQCTLFEIDVDQGQSTNQNVFRSVKASGGIHIKGTATTGIREAHNNIFLAVDTTGANLTATDATTGYHVLNDSVLNQPNLIIGYYAESSGSREVRGNWNIVASQVDASGSTFGGERRNSSLMSAGTGRNGSFLAAPAVSKCRGGDWRELDTDSVPIGLGGSVPRTVVAATNAPDGNPYALECTASSTFQTLQFEYELGSIDEVSLVAFIKRSNNPGTTVVFGSGGAGELQYNSPTIIDVGNGWEMMRASGQGDYLGSGSGSSVGWARVYVTQGSLGSPAQELTVGSFFLANEDTALLPGWTAGQRLGFGTAAPVAGIWQRGDIVWSTTPSAGGVPGWVCVTAGSPGTWKAMATLAV